MKNAIAMAVLSVSMVACGGGGGGSTTPSTPSTPTDARDTAAWGDWVKVEQTGAYVTYNRDCVVTVNGNRDNPAPTCSGESSKVEIEPVIVQQNGGKPSFINESKYDLFTEDYYNFAIIEARNGGTLLVAVNKPKG